MKIFSPTRSIRQALKLLCDNSTFSWSHLEIFPIIPNPCGFDRHLILLVQNDSRCFKKRCLFNTPSNPVKSLSLSYYTERNQSSEKLITLAKVTQLLSSGSKTWIQVNFTSPALWLSDFRSKYSRTEIYWAFTSKGWPLDCGILIF